MKALEQKYGQLSALTYSPVAKATRAIVLLHGVGSNERDLLELAPLVTSDRLVVSLRAPLVLGAQAFAWFHVQFGPQGPVHNWSEAKQSLILIEEALGDLSSKTGIPTDRISVFGFSQGAIMTIGLALQSRLDLESYIASSGRTLPELAEAARTTPLATYQNRRVLLTHGVEDSKLPIQHARNSEKVLRAASLNLTFKEYPDDHVISRELAADIKNWLA